MLWDTAGQEEFDAITKAYYRGETAGAAVWEVADLPDVVEAPRFYSLSGSSGESISRCLTFQGPKRVCWSSLPQTGSRSRLLTAGGRRSRPRSEMSPRF